MYMKYSYSYFFLSIPDLPTFNKISSATKIQNFEEVKLR